MGPESLDRNGTDVVGRPPMCKLRYYMVILRRPLQEWLGLSKVIQGYPGLSTWEYGTSNGQDTLPYPFNVSD